MSLEHQLRPYRKLLVVAAEKVMGTAFKDIGDLRNEREKGKSQLNHLVSVCNEAACKEEIESYLRYQATRPSVKLWGAKSPNGPGENLAQKVIDEINRIEGIWRNLETDAAGVAAWKLYAVYLTRAYTYQKAATSSAGGRP